MIKTMMMLTVILTSCGSEKSAKEITPQQPDRTKTETRCWYEYEYTPDYECERKRRNCGKRKSCKPIRTTVQVCEEEEKPVGI